LDFSWCLVGAVLTIFSSRVYGVAAIIIHYIWSEGSFSSYLMGYGEGKKVAFGYVPVAASPVKRVLAWW
jgi:hypothetical protein